MNTRAIITAVGMLAVIGSQAEAAVFNLISHNASVSTAAQLNGIASDSSSGVSAPTDLTLQRDTKVSAGPEFRETSAFAVATSAVQIDPTASFVSFTLRTFYNGQSDLNPGGSASASLDSVIKFELLSAGMEIDPSFNHFTDPRFSGNFSFAIKNETSNQLLFEASSTISDPLFSSFDSSSPPTFQVFGSIGDIIAVTFSGSSSGAIEPPEGVGSGVEGDLTTVFAAFREVDSVSAVPVPAAFPLLVTAFAGLGLISRRRKCTSA